MASTHATYNHLFLLFFLLLPMRTKASALMKISANYCFLIFLILFLYKWLLFRFIHPDLAHPYFAVSGIFYDLYCGRDEDHCHLSPCKGGGSPNTHHPQFSTPPNSPYPSHVRVHPPLALSSICNFNYHGAWARYRRDAIYRTIIITEDSESSRVIESVKCASFCT